MMLKTYPFSPVFGANLCLSDIKRVNAFEKAISETVRRGNVVLDVGSGTGILAFLALKYGARKVYAIEMDSYLCKIIEKTAKKNGFNGRVKIINNNVLELDSFSVHIDVVLMEMLTTGLIEEAQIPAYNHLVEKGIITPKTKVIPQGYKTYCIPLEYDFNEYGFHMPRAKHVVWGNLKKKLGSKKLISSIEFNGVKKNIKVNATVEYLISEEENFNSIGLMSIAGLSKSIFLDESLWINNSVVVPIDNNLYLKEESEVRLNIQYEMGKGFLCFKLKI